MLSAGTVGSLSLQGEGGGEGKGARTDSQEKDTPKPRENTSPNNRTHAIGGNRRFTGLFFTMAVLVSAKPLRWSRISSNCSMERTHIRA